jgi:hypothetical protein
MNCPCPCNFFSWALLKMVSITLSTTPRSHKTICVNLFVSFFKSPGIYSLLWLGGKLPRGTYHLSEEPNVFQRNPTSFRATHHLSEEPNIFQRNPPSFRGTQHLSEKPHLSEEPNIFQRNPPSFRKTHHLSVSLALNQKKTSFQ